MYEAKKAGRDKVMAYEALWERGVVHTERQIDVQAGAGRTSL